MYIAVQCYPSYVDHYLNYQMLILIVNGVGEGGGGGGNMSCTTTIPV